MAARELHHGINTSGRCNIDFFVQPLINGISIGFLYGLSAMGFVMIFKSSSVLNFAKGEVLAFGAFLFLALVTWAQLPIWLGFLVTLAGTFVLGFVIERIFLRPLIGEPLIQVIMLTVGLAAMFKGGMLLVWGGNLYTYPDFLPEGLGIRIIPKYLIPFFLCLSELFLFPGIPHIFFLR